MGSIFQGTPQTATSYTTTSSETPKWMQDAIFNQVNWATNVANKPYEPYFLPTVAELSPLQQQAFTGVAASQGAYKDVFGRAQQGLEALAGQDTTEGLMEAQARYLRGDLANANLDAGQALFDRAGALDIAGSAQPLLDQAQSAAGSIRSVASPYVTQAAGMSDTMAANPYLDQAQSTTAQALSNKALSAANPYLQQAAQSSVSNIDAYLNPYQANVLDVIAQQGARNLSENLLPKVADSFIRAGQFGSSRMGEFGSRALRDTQEAVLRTQAPLAQQGYSQALQASGADQTRQANLGSTVGRISDADASRTLQGATQFANLGKTAGQLTGTEADRQGKLAQITGQLAEQEASQLGRLGATTGELAQAEARQLQSLGVARDQAGRTQQAAALSAAQRLQAAQVDDITRQARQLGTLADMSIVDQQANMRDILALEAAGKAQQQQLQTQLSAAEKEFLTQQLYPQGQLAFLGSQTKNIAPYVNARELVGSGSTGKTYDPSPLAQLAAGFATYKGIANLPD